jgi:hypothetical protein
MHVTITVFGALPRRWRARRRQFKLSQLKFSQQQFPQLIEIVEFGKFGPCAGAHNEERNVCGTSRAIQARRELLEQLEHEGQRQPFHWERRDPRDAAW